MKRIIYLVILTLCINIAFGAIDSKAIAISLVNQDPDPAIASDTFEVRIGVENLGATSTDNLYLELKPEYPFTLVASESKIKAVGSLSKFQQEDDMQIVKYKLAVDPDANAGSYELKIGYYEFGSPKIIEKSLSIDVKNKDNAEVIHIDKSILVPGAESVIKFTINNVGNAPLRDLTFSWSNNDGVILPVGSDNTKYVKNLDIGKSETLEYKVIADSNADPGLYKLDLSLIYDDPISSSNTKISTIAGVYVGGETDFEVSFSESTNGETSFNIANIGSNPAYSVSTMIPKQDNWKTSGSNSEIIGNLDKGDYTVATFNVQSLVDRTDATQTTKEKTQGLKLEVAYTDTRGQRHIVEKEVTLSPTMLSTSLMTGTGMRGQKSTTEESSTSIYWYVMIVLLVIIAYYYFKKIKNKK